MGELGAVGDARGVSIVPVVNQARRVGKMLARMLLLIESVNRRNTGMQ